MDCITKLYMNIHADGWSSDEVFRSMRRNCESYKKVSVELQKLKQKCESYKKVSVELQKLKQKCESLQKELDTVKKENESLKKEVGRGYSVLKSWNDYILHVCRDGQQRTAREIFNAIELMDIRPWSSDAKTPYSTCGSTCLDLFNKNKLYKTNDTPLKYFILLP